MKQGKLFPKSPGWNKITERWIIRVLRKEKVIAYATGAGNGVTRTELGFARGLAEGVPANAVRLILCLTPKQQTETLKSLWRKWAVYLAPDHLRELNK